MPAAHLSTPATDSTGHLPGDPYNGLRLDSSPCFVLKGGTHTSSHLEKDSDTHGSPGVKTGGHFQPGSHRDEESREVGLWGPTSGSSSDQQIPRLSSAPKYPCESGPEPHCAWMKVFFIFP